jgi:polyphenol oxidase
MAVPSHGIEELSVFGVRAFVTTREAGTFGLAGDDPVRDVVARWESLHRSLGSDVPRLASARQVHGTRVVQHGSGWSGWLRIPDADGHIAQEAGTALVVNVADCIPVFLVARSGALALLHAGWRGVAGDILGAAVAAFRASGIASADLTVHFGPGICGGCYEVGPDVYRSLTGVAVNVPTRVDLRAILNRRAEQLGIRDRSTSRLCTLCDQKIFFSHRGGDAGRQLAVLARSASVSA